MRRNVLFNARHVPGFLQSTRSAFCFPHARERRDLISGTEMTTLRWLNTATFREASPSLSSVPGRLFIPPPGTRAMIFARTSRTTVLVTLAVLPAALLYACGFAASVQAKDEPA